MVSLKMKLHILEGHNMDTLLEVMELESDLSEGERWTYNDGGA